MYNASPPLPQNQNHEKYINSMYQYPNHTES